MNLITPVYDYVADDVFELLVQINLARLEHERRPLISHECLDEQAMLHCEQMARAGGLSHSGWKKRLRTCGFNIGGAENVAAGHVTAQQVVFGRQTWWGRYRGGWMQSSLHRRNTLNWAWTVCGTAEHERYWCAIFAS